MRVTAGAAVILAAYAGAVEYASYADEVLGFSLEVPGGYTAATPAPLEGARGRAVRLSWKDAPRQELEVLVFTRAAPYESVVVLAALFQRRLGLAAGFDVEGVPLTAAELSRAGGDDGLRAEHAVGEGPGGRRVETLFLAAGPRRWRLEVWYPTAGDGLLAAAAEHVINSFKVLPVGEEGAAAPEGAAAKE